MECFQTKEVNILYIIMSNDDDDDDDDGNCRVECVKSRIKWMQNSPKITAAALDV